MIFAINVNMYSKSKILILHSNNRTLNSYVCVDSSAIHICQETAQASPDPDE